MEIAGVQPQQDPGEPSGWMASANERERERKKLKPRSRPPASPGSPTVEAEANLEGPLYPGQPYLSGFFLMTSSWVGSPIMAPGRKQLTPVEI